jgi:hypothetical protein
MGVSPAPPMSQKATIMAAEMIEALRARKVESKSTDKLMVIMAGLVHMPWEKVKMFQLDWMEVQDTQGKMPMPIVKIMCHDPNEKIELPDLEPDEVES